MLGELFLCCSIATFRVVGLVSFLHGAGGLRDGPASSASWHLRVVLPLNVLSLFGVFPMKLVSPSIVP